eukprot:3141215-Pyramimonas_sp.AAC.1
MEAASSWAQITFSDESARRWTCSYRRFPAHRCVVVIPKTSNIVNSCLKLPRNDILRWNVKQSVQYCEEMFASPTYTKP